MTGPAGLLLAIEAKPLQTQLTDKHAAQLIQYCAVEGIEWAALTNGRELQFFNSFLKPDLTAKRVLRLDLLAFNSDAEFDALFSQLWQLSRESMTTPSGVRSWLNQRRLDAALRAIVLDPSSPAVRQLRSVLANAEISATSQDVAQWFRSHLIPPIVAIAPPQHRTTPVNTGLNEAGTKPDDSGHARPAEIAAEHSVLFQSLRRAIDRRLPDTVWRATNSYLAAESKGETFLAARVRQGRIFLGLTLPSGTCAQNLTDNEGQFKWSRMTKAAVIRSDADVTAQLLDQVEAAQAHSALGTRTKTYHGITLRDLLDEGYLQPDVELILTGAGGREITRARLRSSGEIEWQGHVYRSLSDRAFATLLGRQSLNGWAHWRTGRDEGSESLAEIRTRLQNARAPDAPGSQATDMPFAGTA